MASSSEGGSDEPPGRSFPELYNHQNEFGALTTLLMTGKNQSPLPKKPLLIAKSIRAQVGQIESARTAEKGTQYILNTRKPNQIKELLNLTHLSDGTEIEIKLHPTLNSCRCVIASWDIADMTDDELLSELKSQRVKAVKHIKNTPLFVLTMNQSTYPKHVKVGLLRIETRTYYPEPMLCFKCYQYGHPKLKCPGPKRCYNCSQTHEDARESCEENSHCLHCNENHRPSSRKCIKYKEEKAVIQTKIDLNLSFDEARKRVATGHTTYSKVAAQPRLDRARLDALQEENKKKDELIALLTEKVKQSEALEQKMDVILKVQAEKNYEFDNLLKTVQEHEQANKQLEKQNSAMKHYIQKLQEKIQFETRSTNKSETETRRKSKRVNARAPSYQHSQEISPENNQPPSKKSQLPATYQPPVLYAEEQVVDISDYELEFDEDSSPHYVRKTQ